MRGSTVTHSSEAIVKPLAVETGAESQAGDNHEVFVLTESPTLAPLSSTPVTPTPHELSAASSVADGAAFRLRTGMSLDTQEELGNSPHPSTPLSALSVTPAPSPEEQGLPEFISERMQRIEQDPHFKKQFALVIASLDHYILLIQKYVKQWHYKDSEDEFCMQGLLEKLLDIRYGKKLPDGRRDKNTSIQSKVSTVAERVKLIEDYVLAFNAATIERVGLIGKYFMRTDDFKDFEKPNKINPTYPSSAQIAELLVQIFFGNRSVYENRQGERVKPGEQTDKDRRILSTATGKRIIAMRKSKNDNERRTNIAIGSLVNNVDVIKLTSKAKNSRYSSADSHTRTGAHQKRLQKQMLELLVVLERNEALKRKEKYSCHDRRFYETLLNIDLTLVNERAREMIVGMLWTFEAEEHFLKTHTVLTHIARKHFGKISEKEDILLPFHQHDKAKIIRVIGIIHGRYKPMELLLEANPEHYPELKQELDVLEEWEKSRKKTPPLAADAFSKIIVDNFGVIHELMEKGIHKRDFRTPISQDLAKALPALSQNLQSKNPPSVVDWLQILTACMNLQQVAIQQNAPADIRAVYQFSQTAIKGCMRAVSKMIGEFVKTNDKESLAELRQLAEILQQDPMTEPALLFPEKNVYEKLAAHTQLIQQTLSGLSAVTRNLGEAIDCRLPAEIIHDDVAAKNLFMGSKLAKAYVELLDNYLQQRFKPKSSIAIARKLKAKLEKSIAVINNTDLEMTDRIYALQDMQNAFNAAITHRVGNQVNQLKQHSFFSRLVDFIAGNRTSLKTILNNFVMQRPQPSLKDPKLMVLVSHQDFLRNASRRIANLRRKINLEWNNQTSLKQHLSHLQKKIADRILPVTAAGLKAKEQNDKKGREHIEDIFIQLDQLEKGRPPIRVNSIAYEVKFVRPATALLSANGMWAGTAKGALSTVNEEVKDEKAEASLSQSASLRMTNG